MSDDLVRPPTIGKRRAETILKEEEYLERMAQIIRRDFYSSSAEQ